MSIYSIGMVGYLFVRLSIKGLQYICSTTLCMNEWLLPIFCLTWFNNNKSVQFKLRAHRPWNHLLTQLTVKGFSAHIKDEERIKTEFRIWNLMSVIVVVFFFSRVGSVILASRVVRIVWIIVALRPEKLLCWDISRFIKRLMSRPS